MMQRVTQSLITGTLKAAQVQSVRTCYPYHHRLIVIARPHVKRISFPEKMFWGAWIALTIVSVPAYIAVHFPEYRGETKK